VSGGGCETRRRKGGVALTSLSHLGMNLVAKRLKGRFWGGGGGRPGGGRMGRGEGWGCGGETEVAGVDVEEEDDLSLLEDGVMAAMLWMVSVS
jgi:hypothetical protein